MLWRACGVQWHGMIDDLSRGLDASRSHEDAFDEVLRQQADGDRHDLGLIVERLGWTPDQRLEANAAFLRFYLSIRPQGPLIRDE